MDDAEKEQQLEDLAEEELGEVPVVLAQGDDEGLHGVSPPVHLMIVLTNIVQRETCHSTTLKLMPHEGWNQESNCLQIIVIPVAESKSTKPEV